MWSAVHRSYLLLASSTLFISTAEARLHYQAQIRCIGDPPYDYVRSPGNFPLQAGLVGPYNTARSMCAKAAYGGNYDVNAGAFCHWQATPPSVVFERGNYARMGVDLPYSMYAFCINRCRCLKNLTDMAISTGTIPATEVVLSELQFQNRWETGIRPYDVNPARSRFWKVTPSQYPGFINMMDVFFAEESVLGLDSPHIAYQPLLIHEGPRAPRCDGVLPPWGSVFPSPFRLNMFSTLKNLCVVSYFGGNRLGNAGLLCLVSGELVMSEEFVHPSFVLFDSPLGLAVQAYCRSLCRCDEQLDPKHLTKPKSILLRDWPGLDVLVAFPQNGVTVYTKPKHETSRTDRTWSSVIVPGRLSSAKHGDLDPLVADFCGKLGCRFTTDMSWIQDRINPQLPPQSKFAIGRPKVNQSPICGGSCSKFRDCANDINTACRCMVRPEALEYMRAGYNPRYPNPTAVCLGGSDLELEISVKSGLKLGGRGLILNNGDVESPFRQSPQSARLSSVHRRSHYDLTSACPCNNTYVSFACCEAPSGLVWESIEQKLGEL